MSQLNWYKVYLLEHIIIRQWTRKATRPKGVENYASAGFPNLFMASFDLDLWSSLSELQWLNGYVWLKLVTDRSPVISPKGIVTYLGPCDLDLWPTQPKVLLVDLAVTSYLGLFKNSWLIDWLIELFTVSRKSSCWITKGLKEKTWSSNTDTATNRWVGRLGLASTHHCTQNCHCRRHLWKWLLRRQAPDDDDNDYDDATVSNWYQPQNQPFQQILPTSILLWACTAFTITGPDWTYNASRFICIFL